MPLAPENIVITRDMLSEVTIEMGEKFGSKFLPQRKSLPEPHGQDEICPPFRQSSILCQARDDLPQNPPSPVVHSICLDLILHNVQYGETEKFEQLIREGPVQASFKFGEYLLFEQLVGRVSYFEKLFPILF